LFFVSLLLLHLLCFAMIAVCLYEASPSLLNYLSLAQINGHVSASKEQAQGIN
jgi:hypothetical protein